MFYPSHRVKVEKGFFKKLNTNGRKHMGSTIPEKSRPEVEHTCYDLPSKSYKIHKQPWNEIITYV